MTERAAGRAADHGNVSIRNCCVPSNLASGMSMRSRGFVYPRRPPLSRSRARSRRASRWLSRSDQGWKAPPSSTGCLRDARRPGWITLNPGALLRRLTSTFSQRNSRSPLRADTHAARAHQPRPARGLESPFPSDPAGDPGGSPGREILPGPASRETIGARARRGDAREPWRAPRSVHFRSTWRGRCGGWRRSWCRAGKPVIREATPGTGPSVRPELVPGADPGRSPGKGGHAGMLASPRAEQPEAEEEDRDPRQRHQVGEERQL